MFKFKNSYKKIKTICGNIVDVQNNEIFAGKITVSNGKILNIEKVDEKFDTYILPGFIDSHIHIESTMLVPSQFARTAVKNGMIAVLADPHEIANVCGTKGIDFMLESSKNLPLTFYYMIPSCVPATKFDESYMTISAKQIEKYYTD